MNPDPIAALRAVLAENARIPALEAEIAHLRKHNASPKGAPEAEPQCPRCGSRLCWTGYEESFPGPTVGRAACSQCSWEGKVQVVDAPRGARPIPDPPQHLPCPFCGGKGFVDSRVAPSLMNAARCRATVACVKCSMIGPSAVGANHTESIANAWAAWDRRDGGSR
jgi:hypothetical protein